MEQRIASWRSCAQSYFERRVRDPHAVDDLVQETCVHAWLSERSGRVDRVADPYVRGISWRVLARHRRRMKVRQRADRNETDLGTLLGNVPAVGREQSIRVGEERLRLSVVLSVLDRCVDELPARWRGLVRDRMQGASLREIAERSGLSVNRIKLRLYRGRRALREAILASLRQEEVHAFESVE